MAAQYMICPDDLSGAAVTALLQFHLDEMHRHSPAESVHAMPAQRLRQSDVSFFTAWDGDTLAGCGALKALGIGAGELKSMRVAPAYRRKGAGRALLVHMIKEARARGYTRVSLETGRSEPFHPAHNLYLSHGFVECAPFADYQVDPFSMCMTLEL